MAIFAEQREKYVLLPVDIGGNMLDNPKNAALFWLSQGVATVPLVYQSKKPLVSWSEYKVRLPSKAQIDLWYDDNYFKNLAIVCGWNGLVVLDFDNLDFYVAWHVYHLEHNQSVLDTYRVMSNRGIHVYYYLREPMRLNSIQSALFEVKNSGRLCTIPPSIHESGKPYTSLDNPQNIRTVKPDEILNYSPICFQPLVYPTLKASKYAPTISPTQQDSLISEIKAKISLLSFFPVTQQLDNEKRFYRTHCPIHGHKDNFWLDTKLGICGCYAGCCPTMDVITLFSKMNNLDIKQSIQELRRMLWQT